MPGRVYGLATLCVVRKGTNVARPKGLCESIESNRARPDAPHSSFRAPAPRGPGTASEIGNGEVVISLGRGCVPYRAAVSACRDETPT
jgi:hypothetical protein